MKKIIYILIIFIFGIQFLFSMNEYNATSIGSIQIGNNIGEIGYDAKGLPGDGPLTAKIFTIGPNNNLYIFDKLDGKIQIYTLNLSFIKEINVRTHLVLHIYHMKINEKGDIILYDGFGLKKINFNGELIYEVKKNLLPAEIIYDRNYFPYDDFVFYYDKNNNINCIDPNGNIMEDEAVERLINEINSSIIIKSPNEEEMIDDMLEDFNEKEKLLILQNRILSSNGYFLVNKVYKYLREKKGQTKSNSNNTEIKVAGYYLIGYDSEYNSYWESDAGFFVFSKYGEYLDSFKQLTIGMGYEAVSPAGDLYYWEVKPEGVFFYKITRRW